MAPTVWSGRYTKMPKYVGQLERLLNSKHVAKPSEPLGENAVSPDKHLYLKASSLNFPGAKEKGWKIEVRIPTTNDNFNS